jgi:hypothetical protein
MVLVQQPDEIAVSTPFKKFPDMLTSETESGIIKPIPEDNTATKTISSPPPLPPIPLSKKELQTRKILLSVLVALFLLLITAVGVLMTVKGNRLDQISPEHSDIPVDDSSVISSETHSEVHSEAAAPQKNSQEDILENTAKNTQNDNSEKIPENTAHTATEEVSSDIPATSPNQTEMTEVTEKETEKNTKTDNDLKSDQLAALLAQTPKEPEIRSTTDLLSDIEKKMPGIFPASPLLSLDISARLAIPLTGLKLDKTPLLDAIRLFSDLTEIPITFDIDEMRPRGIQIDRPLTLQFDNGTAGEMLTKILAVDDLEPVIEDRQLLITVAPERRNNPTERTFDVTDLVENTKNSAQPLTPEYLAEILQRLIDPTNNSFIRIAGNSLVVQNRFRQLDETLRVLEQLRVIRNLPQQTEVVGELLVPEAFGWDAMMTPITLNYYRPTPLSEIFTQLESATKLHILIDHKALHRALSPLQPMKATVSCNHGTVHEALEKLLASVDVASLTYRIVGHDTLEITTTDTTRQPEKMSIEIHRFTTATDETPEELVRIIRSALEPDSWRLPNDPETVGHGDIVIDYPAACLLIRQSQPVQHQIRLWLGNKQTQEK